MKELGFDSVGVLAHIILKCVSFGYPIDLTKGQKLLYCCYGVALALKDTRICKEHPKAWQYGPAFPRAYKHHKDNRIDFSSDPIATCDDPELIRDIDDTIKFYGKYNASSLVNWTHKEDGPWAISSQKGTVLYNDIPDELIKEYFKTFVSA